MGDSLDAYVRNRLPAAELEALTPGLRRIRALGAFAPCTIDNEISYLAAAAVEAATHPAAAATGESRFSSLCFATDYVRGEASGSDPAVFNLSNNRSPAARERRDLALGRASELLRDYLTRR